MPTRWRRRKKVREMTATTAEQPTEAVQPGATGRVARVIGPVVDIEFPADAIPGMYNALTAELTLGGETKTVTLRSLPTWVTTSFAQSPSRPLTAWSAESLCMTRERRSPCP